MDEKIKAEEVLDLAQKAAEKGIKLYETLASKSRNFHVSDTFRELARKEKSHLNELKKMEKRLEPFEPHEAYPGEYTLYIKAMADENSFKCDQACKTFLELDLSEHDALQAGIVFEKDFILFLHNLKKHMREEKDIIVDTIIKSEESHLKKLYTLKNKI